MPWGINIRCKSRKTDENQWKKDNKTNTLKRRRHLLARKEEKIIDRWREKENTRVGERKSKKVCLWECVYKREVRKWER